MSGDPVADSRAILETLQAAVDARDRDALLELFDDPAVLIGASGDGRDRQRLVDYLTEVATQEPFRWEWDEVIPFHSEPGALGFAAFGDLVVSAPTGEMRAPIRVTIFAVETADGWRLRQFHGSIPHGL